MKKISKIFAVFLAILMVICALPISASAQDVTLTITSNKSDVKAGETVIVDVILSENSNLNYFTIDLVYDNSKLEYVSNSMYEICGNEIINPSYSVNKIRMVVARVEPITAGGVILSVEFKALSSSCNTFSIEVIESADANFKEIPITASPIRIHSYSDWTTVINSTCETAGLKRKSCSCGDEYITEEILATGHKFVDGVCSTCGKTKLTDVIIGDVNEDGVVNTLDRVILTRYIAKWEEYSEGSIDAVAADVNCDGKVNTLDRVILTRYIAKWEGYETLPYNN